MAELIEIYTEELPPDWTWRPTDKFKTGTTEFYVETAKWLARFGHEVIVYYDEGPAEGEQVLYLPRELYKGDNVVLACNSRPPRPGKRTVFWNNLKSKTIEMMPGFDDYIVLSPYHQRSFKGGKIVGHGCYPHRYKDVFKIPKSCLYSSSPDRGLELLEEIWPRVEEETGAELTVTYRNALPEKVMDDLYKTSQFWLHPGQGVELFCISALKAQAAGCIPVVVPNMALKDTVKYGVFATKETYADKLIDAIKKPPKIEKIPIPSWEEVTRELETVLLGT